MDISMSDVMLWTRDRGIGWTDGWIWLELAVGGPEGSELAISGWLLSVIGNQNQITIILV